MLNAPHRRRGSRLKDEAQTGHGEEKQTVSRKLTSIITAAAIAATSLGTLTTSAYAGGGYRNGGHGHYDDRGYRGGRDRYYARGYKKRNNTGKYIAIGAAALMLGIIASEASRR